MQSDAKEWRESVNMGTAPPASAVALWEQFRGLFSQETGALAVDNEACGVLVRLLALSDAASVGLGIRAGSSDVYVGEAERVLLHTNFTTLCKRVHSSKARVLPKQHTPQRGMTLRSLSHHLALCPATDVVGEWRPPMSTPHHPMPLLNLLLLPWPTVIDRRSFRLETGVECATARLPANYGFFGFSRPDDPAFEPRLRAAIKRARAHVHVLHGVVFPELALTEREARRAREIAMDEGVMLIAGVGVPADASSGTPPRNFALFDAGPLLGEKDAWGPAGAIVEQAKHHRWCLDSRQIVQYGLGGILPASRDCWELIELGERKIHFLTLDTWLTMTVLICEDLARQDPVAELLRSVGPNLVIALLMDGPQLRSRWSSRYASVLAEDPGSSVLSLTSLGMTSLSAPRPGETDRRRVVGLWRDAIDGERELDLRGPESEGGVLSLVCRTYEEWSADGRGDGRTAHFPVFAGFQEV